MREFIKVITVLLLVASGPSVAVAHDATPAADGSLLAGQGFPELSLTADDNGLTNAPSSVDAGRYLVALDATGTSSASLNLIRVSDDSTYDATAELFVTTYTADELPDEFYDLGLAGGTLATAGDSSQVIVDLTPGDWVIGLALESADGDTASTATYELMVTGTFPSVDDPTSDVDVEMYEMGFDLPDQIDSGPRVWHLTNTGDQPHFIDVALYPEPFTVDQALTALAGSDEATSGSATPDPDALDSSLFEEVAHSSLVSSGLDEWVQFDLAPGNYIALCWIPDRESGAPHAFMGMARTFTVV